MIWTPFNVWYFFRYYVLTLGGVSGFVPRNYVQREPVLFDDFIKELDSAREKVKNGQLADREKGDLLAKLDAARKNFVDEHQKQPQQPNAIKVTPQQHQQPQQQHQQSQQKVIQPQQQQQPPPQSNQNNSKVVQSTHQLQAIPEQSSSQNSVSSQQDKSPQLNNRAQQQKIQVCWPPLKHL